MRAYISCIGMQRVKIVFLKDVLPLLAVTWLCFGNRIELKIFYRVLQLVEIIPVELVFC